MAKKKRRLTYIVFGATYEDAMRRLEGVSNKKTERI